MSGSISLIALLAVVVQASAQAPAGAPDARAPMVSRPDVPPATTPATHPPKGVGDGGVASTGSPDVQRTGLDHAELRRMLRQQYDQRSRAAHNPSAP